MTNYESARSERLTIEGAGAHEIIRIRAMRQTFVIVFLCFWLCAWTFGGLFAIGQLGSGNGTKETDWFLMFWLCLWALGWLSVAWHIAWSLFGSEIVRIAGRDLEIARAVLSMERRKRYKGDDIHAVAVAVRQLVDRADVRRLVPPDAVQFRYGGRMVTFGAGLDNAEAQTVVDRLRSRLPRSASVD